MQHPTDPIVVHGPTGYTGQLTCRELVRWGCPIRLVGRRPDALAELAGLLPTDAVEVVVAAADDVPALVDACAGAHVMVNCAGPYMEVGDGPAQAAVASGTHYIDCTGEQDFMRLLHRRLDAAARQAGVVVLPAMGFDYAPGDLLCSLLAGGLDQVDEFIVAYRTEGFSPSLGTLRSAARVLGAGGVRRVEGTLQPLSMHPRAHRFIGDRQDSVVVPYPSGEALTVPGHTGARTVTSLLAAPMPGLLPGPARRLAARALPGVMRAAGGPLGLALGAGSRILPTGPSDDDREAAVGIVEAVGLDLDGRSVAGRITIHDVYGTTARLLVAAARLLESDGGGGASGVCAPAQVVAAGSFLERPELREHVEVELGLAAPPMPAR